MITKEKLQQLLESADYVFAKSMPKNPHWHTMRYNWKYKDFVDAVLAIRHYGKKEKFYRAEFTYFYVRKYKYWTMGNDVSETILINKARIKDDNADWIP